MRFKSQQVTRKRKYQTYCYLIHLWKLLGINKIMRMKAFIKLMIVDIQRRELIGMERIVTSQFKQGKGLEMRVKIP